MQKCGEPVENAQNHPVSDSFDSHNSKIKITFSHDERLYDKRH